MKYKKYSYILVTMLMLMLGMSNIHAEETKTCYYISSDESFKATIRIAYNKDVNNGDSMKNTEDWGRATIFKTPSNMPITSYEVKNWFRDITIQGETAKEIYTEKSVANADTNPQCPRYVLYATCPTFFGLFESKATVALNDEITAKKIIENSKKCSYSGYASNYKNGSQITKEQFFAGLEKEGLIKYDPNIKEYTCETITELFGDPKKPDSIRYMLNEILGFIRVMVPILIILFGTLDFAKAVIAGKEDNMRKARTDFVKRIIAGVAVFLVPTLVNIIMELADIVWQGTGYVSCDLI